MNIQTKLFNWPDQGNHVIIMGRGTLGVPGLKKILDEIATAATAHANCKVLVDLVDAACGLDSKEIDRLLREHLPEPWPRECKTALVSPTSSEEYARLAALRCSLMDHGLRIEVFQDSRAAVEWLADAT